MPKRIVAAIEVETPKRAPVIDADAGAVKDSPLGMAVQ